MGLLIGDAPWLTEAGADLERSRVRLYGRLDAEVLAGVLRGCLNGRDCGEVVFPSSISEK